MCHFEYIAEHLNRFDTSFAETFYIGIYKFKIMEKLKYLHQNLWQKRNSGASIQKKSDEWDNQT